MTDTTTDHTFTTESPVDLYVEIGKGSVEVQTAHASETTVLVSGSHADEVTVTHDGDALVSRVVVPRSCLPRAPDRLRFRGIATEGLFASDQTRLSAAIDRG